MKALTILITGATAGIGRHTALALARAGHRVFAAGRRANALESLEKEAAEGGGLKLEGIVLDVTKADSIEAAKKAIEEKTGGYGVDAVVNNAGYGSLGPLEEVTEAALRAQFETNVFGLMAVTRAFLPKMRERGFGRVVNISSLGGRVTFPLMGAYHGTKYAVEAFSDALRNELHPFGIGVSIVEPGYIRTEFADVAMKTIDVPATSPFAPIVARAEELLGLFEKTGVGPEHIARAIRKALESRRPSARYVAPWRTYMGLWMFRLLPTAWMDVILRAATGLKPRTLRALPAAPAHA
ncbi:MAG TPA: SDR family oxidoreductase [Polyangiaceae bacterium]|jgi:short-subunit dehydrogenase